MVDGPLDAIAAPGFEIVCPFLSHPPVSSVLSCECGTPGLLVSRGRGRLPRYLNYLGLVTEHKQKEHGGPSVRLGRHTLIRA